MDFYILLIQVKIHLDNIFFILFLYCIITMNKLIVIGIILILILLLLKPSDEYQPNQEQIQDLSYIDKHEYKNNFPYPQISNTFKRLSKGKFPEPLNNESDILPKEDRSLKITRTIQTPETISKDRLYLPDYYRKDRLDGNPEGTEELRPFITDENKSEQSWTDENISEHPKFYNSELKDEITNIGSFFDKNNQYNDTTSANTNVLPSDKCFTDKLGNNFCKDNTRLQLIPPQLIVNPESNKAINSI